MAVDFFYVVRGIVKEDDAVGYRGRDVEVTFTNGVGLVAACDSCGAIGEKEWDVVKVSAELTGRFTARVALLEVLAAGAEPKIVTAAICNEREPTGSKLLEGVRMLWSLRELSLKEPNEN